MAQSKSKLDEYRENFLFLTAFGAFFDSRFPGASHISFQVVPDQPGDHEKVSARQRDGLRQAVNDVLEMTADFTPAQIADADAFLRERGATTLSIMSARCKNLVSRILTRGRVRSETEYHLLKALVSDTESPLSAEQRLEIGALLRGFSPKA